MGVQEQRKRFVIWKPNRHVWFVQVGEILRVREDSGFALHRYVDGWYTSHDSTVNRSSLNIHYVDVREAVLLIGASIGFTFFGLRAVIERSNFLSSFMLR